MPTPCRSGVPQGKIFGHYSNPDVERPIAAAAGQTDESLAKETLNAADQRLTNDAYVLPLYQKPTFIALYDNIANVRNNSSAGCPAIQRRAVGLPRSWLITQRSAGQGEEEGLPGRGG